MKIYSMTATFGKLENQTIILRPGLNVISAPNEWGKSTWCAFLVNMLYGLETRIKTTKTAIVDKDRYAPWSGAPMSGRIELNWNGRDITIERWTKGRTPMGEFRAYETASGIAVPELTATTCGEMLLGVERSVFLRSGFLRLTDLPVTEDDALRRRLNSLVTTGDESGAADILGQKLKELKNKCRSNRTNGLLPVAEEEKRNLEEKLRKLCQWKAESQEILEKQQDVKTRLQLLENHKAALEYAACEENNRRIAAAQAAVLTAQQQESQLRNQCANLPDVAVAQKKLQQLQSLQQQQQDARLQLQMQPQMPSVPVDPHFAYGLQGGQAMQQVQQDEAEYRLCMEEQKTKATMLLIGAAAAVLAVVLLALKLWIPGAVLLMAGVAALMLHITRNGKVKAEQLKRIAKAESIRARYGGGEPENWLAKAQQYCLRWNEYEAQLGQHHQIKTQLQQRLAEIDAALMEATGEEGFAASVDYWKQVITQQENYAEAKKELSRVSAYAADLAAMAQQVEKPAMPDTMTLSPAETEQMLGRLNFELQDLQQRYGQCRGHMEATGQEELLQRRLEQVNERINRLTETYAALELAQETLATATAQLQSRFAPRIASEAQKILQRMTGGRYDRLTIDQDLSLNAGAKEETVLRNAQRRSEGTVDQIYLALRLAVSKELTPNAPWVLDDALVRFDDVRHAAAMEILKEEALERQIILFTCQSRESK